MFCTPANASTYALAPPTWPESCIHRTYTRCHSHQRTLDATAQRSNSIIVAATELGRVLRSPGTDAKTYSIPIARRINPAVQFNLILSVMLAHDR